MQFYGLGWSDLLEMEMVWFSKLYQKIPLVEARRLLGWLDVVMYPHLTKKQDRQRLVAGLERRAGYKALRYLTSADPARVATAWDMLRDLGVSRNGDKGDG